MIWEYAKGLSEEHNRNTTGCEEYTNLRRKQERPKRLAVPINLGLQVLQDVGIPDTRPRGIDVLRTDDIHCGIE